MTAKKPWKQKEDPAVIISREKAKCIGFRQEVSERMNKHILTDSVDGKVGHEYNPSLNTLLRFGGVIDLSEEALQVLEEGAERHREGYQIHVIPFLPEVMKAFTGSRRHPFNAYDPNPWDVDKYKQMLRNQYYRPQNKWDVNGEDKLDNLTLTALMSDEPLPKENHDAVLYYPKLKRGRVNTAREKTDESKSEKALRKVREAILSGNLPQVYEFIPMVAYNQRSAFDEQFHNYLEKNFDKEVTRLLPGDEIGVRQTILQKDKVESLFALIHDSTLPETPNFRCVRSRTDYHYKTRDPSRPGGIHTTWVSKNGLYVLEAQIHTVPDEIKDKLSKAAHHLYKG